MTKKATKPNPKLTLPGNELAMTGAPPSETGLTINLPPGIEECNRLHGLITKSSQMAARLTEVSAHLAVLMGLQLRWMKESTPRGGWRSLFPAKGKGVTCDNFEFSYETSQRYIRAAEGALERPGLSAKHRNLLIEMGQSAGTGSTDPLMDAEITKISLTDEVQEALSAATRGQTLRQLYLDLGIIKGDAVERGAPKDDSGEDGEPVDGDGEVPELTPPTPEEMWELLWLSGIKEVEKFFLAKNHTVLSRTRAEELEEALDGWLKDLRALKWD